MRRSKSIRRVFDVQEPGDGQWESRVSGLIGRVTYLRGGEAVIAGRLDGRNTVVVRFRRKAVPEITTAWRLKDSDSNEVFDIKSIAPNGRSEIDLTCTVGSR